MGNLERIRIAICEQDARWRNHLAVLLAEPPLNGQVTLHASTDSALRSLSSDKPGLLILGLDSVAAGHVETIFQFKAADRRLRIIVSGLAEDSWLVVSLLAAGADALVARSESSLKLLDAVDSVRRGQAFLSAGLARVLIESLRKTEALRRDLDGLSRRELDVLQLLSTGRTDQEIACSLGIAVRTVGTHLQHIYEKIDVHTRAAAVAKYLVGSSSVSITPGVFGSRARPSPPAPSVFRKTAGQS